MKKTLSLYIHIPFCKTICTYCAFLTFAHKNRWIPNYIDSLIQEIKLKSPKFQKYQIISIYYGGGTPSLIDSIYIEKIYQTLQDHFNIKNNVEISLESNPESLTLAKIKHYQKIGINRISLGVQSLNPRTLFKVARPHSELQIFEALKNLQDAQFINFGLDLIMGLPYQTLPEFKQQLKTLLKYHPTHLSAYFLNYDTPKIDLFLKDCPTEDLQIKMYEHFIKQMNINKFIHYEVSNYALSGYQCQHNQRYWNRQEYLGLGLGAHSFINETVSENSRDFDKYLENPLLLEDSYQLDQETQRMDYIMLSLRQNSGLDLNSYKKIAGEIETAKLIKSALPYLEQKKLTLIDNSIKPTEQGFLIIDKITKDLL